MKKFSINFLVLGLLSAGFVNAQSLQEGINDVYAERYKSAKATFEKLLAANPNNIDATYWLGQNYLESEDVAGAKAVYDKALLASANAPLVIVGRGQVDLLENKVSEARQRFEAAITMTRGKKGDDPAILNAVGRAIVEVYNDKTKIGDINYAVEKLEAAAARDGKNPEIFLNLGNAYRKAKPGEAGGVVFQNYNKAIEVNPNFAPAYKRLAELFQSQRNWELYDKYLKDAIAKDPRFAPAYYDLYYYYLGKDLNASEGYAKKYLETSDPDPQNDYLRVTTLWAKKDFDGAIAGAKNIISQAGAATKGKVYKLIADSYLQKKDTASAKQFVDDYFAKEKPENIVGNDYTLKAAVYSIVPGAEDSVYNAYIQGVAADSVMENKVKLLKSGAEFFKGKGQREKEGDILNALVQLKPKPTINELFDVGRAYYFGAAYTKSYDAFKNFQSKYPEEVFGYEWKFNNARVLDSTKRDSIAVPDAQALLDFATKDTVKYKKQYITAAGYLVEYYANFAKDAPKAIEYAKKLVAIDPSNEGFKGILDQLQKSQRTPARAPAKTGTKTGSSGKTSDPNKPIGS